MLSLATTRGALSKPCTPRHPPEATQRARPLPGTPSERGRESFCSGCRAGGFIHSLRAAVPSVPGFLTSATLLCGKDFWFPAFMLRARNPFSGCGTDGTPCDAKTGSTFQFCAQGEYQNLLFLVSSKQPTCPTAILSHHAVLNGADSPGFRRREAQPT